MEENAIRKLSRTDLLQLLVEQAKEIEKLKEIIADQEAKIADRSIKIGQCGSIAEAALSLNGVWQAAQQAADQYVEEVKKKCEADVIEIKQAKETVQSECDQMRTAANMECASMRADTIEECTTLRNTVIAESTALREKTEKECREAREKAIEESGLLKNNTAKECKELLDTAQAKAKQLTDNAEQIVEERWAGLSERMEAFYEAHKGIRELLESSFGKI